MVLGTIGCMQQANIFTAASIGFLLGVLLASFFTVVYAVVLSFALSAPFIAIIAWEKNHVVNHVVKYVVLFVVVVFFATLGAVHFSQVNDGILNNDPVQLEGALLAATIVETPDVRTDKTFLVIEAEGIENKIRVSTNNLTKYSYGEQIVIEGGLQAPENFADFDYRGWLAGKGIEYVMYQPAITKIAESPSSFRSLASSTKERMRLGLAASLLPPHSSLYSAMVLGDKGMLTLGQKEQLQRAGLSHIVAISGMHIAIIVMILMTAGLWIGLWRKQASLFALVLIAFYILMIGAPASAMRAGIMASTVFTAERFGRPNSSWRALLLAAAVLVAINPLILRYDVGFQLSFLAVAGILLLSKKIEYYLWKLPEVVIPFHITRDRKVWDEVVSNKAFGVRGLLAMTLSAQVFTFPLILYHFGTFSPWSPLTNLLVVPMIPYTLMAGFSAALGGIVGGVVAQVVAAPAWLFSNYIWFVVSTFS